MTNLGLAAGCSLYLWVSVPFLRPVGEWLRSHGYLRITMAGIGLALLAGLVYRWLRVYRMFSTVRLVALLVIAGAYALAMTRGVAVAEEGIHYLQAGLLVFLWHRALNTANRWPVGSGVLWRAGLIAFCVAALEEVIQIFIPSRQFDWTDIGKSALGVVLGMALIRATGPNVRGQETVS